MASSTYPNTLKPHQLYAIIRLHLAIHVGNKMEPDMIDMREVSRKNIVVA